MFTLLHQWFIDRSVRTGSPPPWWTRRAEARNPTLRAFRTRMVRVEAALLNSPAEHPRPSPTVRQTVLDAVAATPHRTEASVRLLFPSRIALPLAAAAALLIAAVPVWLALQERPESRLADPRPPEEPAQQDAATGIAVALAARRELAPATPLLEEARRLVADTQAVRDGLLARIPFIHDHDGDSGPNGL